MILEWANGDGTNESLLLVAGRSDSDLLARLHDLEGAETSGVLEDGAVRLALLNPTIERRAFAARIVQHRQSWHGPNGLWFTRHGLLTEHGKIAFVFPGADTLWNSEVNTKLPFPSELASDTSPLDLFDGVGRLLQSGYDLHHLLLSRGIVPTGLAGQSIGEWTAMLCAGICSFSAIDLLLAHIRRTELQLPNLQFLALACDMATALEITAGCDLFISHDNCPLQTVICGSEAGMEKVKERVRSRRIVTTVLAIRSGYHTPFLEPSLDQLRSSVDQISFSKPEIEVWSATTCQPYPSEERGIRALAMEHLIKRVRFRELTLEMYEGGFRVFVQVGVGRTPAFIANTLQGKDILAISAATSGQPLVTAVNRVIAACWVEGLPGFERSMLPHLFLNASRPIVCEASAVGVRRPIAIKRDPEGAQVRPELKRTATISIASMPYLLDHCLVRQHPSWPNTEDRFPVSPMTATLELMSDVAQGLATELVPVGLESARILRPLSASPPQEVELEARQDRSNGVHASSGGGDLRVAISIRGYARCLVQLAPSFPETDERRMEELRSPIESPVNASQIYSDRWMFHGPYYRGVHAISRMGSNGVDGTIVGTGAPGSLLDAAGQLLGLWLMMNSDENSLALPVGIESVKLYSLEPAVGSPVSATVRVTRCDSSVVRADLELWASGRLYVRACGWEIRRLGADKAVVELFRWPEVTCLSDSAAGQITIAREHWKSPMTQDLVMRGYLGEAERRRYEAMTPLGQRSHLLGRVAAKDNVRRVLWERGANPMWPAEVEIANESSGRPYIKGPAPANGIEISISHAPGIGVAIANGERNVGIDIELVGRPEDASLPAAFSDGELDILTRDISLSSLSERYTRGWTAKEAVAKCFGTGLRGRPKDFQVRRVMEGRGRTSLLVNDQLVQTIRVRDHVVAYCVQGEESIENAS
jgi:phosphopantetheinyl transferase